MAGWLKPKWSTSPWAWSLLGFSLALTLFMQLNPATTDTAAAYAFYFPWRCPLNFLTGWSCLGCGLTRSVLLVLSGDLLAAFKMHPLGPFAALAITVHVVLWVYRPEFLAKLYKRRFVFPSGSSFLKGRLRA